MCVHKCFLLGFSQHRMTGVCLKVDAENGSSVLTPLGASLDEQSSSPTKGPQRNGCSFEDDLSLGAEANFLQNGTAKPVPSCEMLATEKRNQFRQKDRSMNSTGSGKSSGTVSSVSELLDRYEEDPEQILYNLGFGRDEPDIASKIPSRFFNWSSSAKGIDIKVYLEAQMQRMELENPNYALTSRFRQTEVLATVANVFSEIYSHVSGRPVEPICQVEPQFSEPAPLKRNNSALNAAKILKRNLTRPNLLLNSTEGSQTNNSKSSETESHSDSEGKHIKFASCLATVTEEALQGGGDTSNSTEKINSELINGQQSSSAIAGVVLDVTDNPVLVNGTSISHSDSVWSPERSKISSSSQSDKEHFPFLPNPHMTHLLSQTKDSFEMEELQSNEDEALPMNHSFSRNEGYSRTASQQSDSSGFAEDPSTDGPANFLKVQESSDSCDSETTVTSHSGDGTSRSSEKSAFGEKLLIQPTIGFLKDQQEVPRSADEHGSSQCVMDQTRPEASSEMQVNTRSSGFVLETSSSTESASTVESTAPALSRDPEPSTASRTAGQQDLTNGRIPDDLVESDLSTSPRTLESEPKSGSLTESKPCIPDHGTTGTTRGANQRSSSFEDRRGRVWVRTRELLQDTDNRVKSPFIRSSSLPTTLLSPSRVVSSIRIQLNQGSVRHCTPPCYSYRYEDEQDGEGAIAEEDEHKAPTASKPNRALKNCKGDSFNSDLDDAGVPPYPLNMSQNLTRSASSLYSTPSDWPKRRLAEGPVWSTSSVPDLTPYTGTSHPAIPRHIQQELNSFRGGVNSPYQKSPNFPSRSGTPLNNAYPYTHSGMYPQYLPSQNSPFPHPPYTPPHHPPTHFSQPYTHPQSIPFQPSPPFHSPSPSPHYGSTFNLHANPYSPQVHLTHSYSAPYSLAYNNAPYHPHMPYGHQYNSQYHLPSEFTSPCDGMTPSPSMSSTEMQLRRVLHEIRGTVQSLGQPAPESRNETPTGAHGSHRAAQPLYEELQRRRQNLNLFRSQMMDLELTLIRQQSMVYQLLSPDERHEAEQLQRLRVAVRQELQELELQLEGRIEVLDDQLHSGRNSQLYRHPLDMARGYSMDSLSSSSALKATEPVSDLLREQMCLQSELSYDGSVGALDTPTSARSSRSASPTRSRDREDLNSQRGRRGVFSSSVSLTPSIPSRCGTESQERSTTSRATEVSNQRPAEPVSTQRDVKSTKGEEPQQQGDRQKEESGGNAYLQQVIQQIKQSLAHEIRQEIVTELLAAVSPQRSPVVTQDSAQ